MKQLNKSIPCRSTRLIARRPVPTLPPPPSVDHIVLGANQVHDALSAPGSQNIGQFEIANSIVPARHVSGDFASLFERNGYWYVALVDLMGKGLSAAMWMTHVLDLIHRACEPGDSLPEIMQRLNREIHLSRVGAPLTAIFLARIEPGESRISYSCGGCPPAFLLNRSRVVSLHHVGGPLLGAFANSTYEAGTINFNPGDILLAVSDGVIELHHGIDFELRPDQVIRHLLSTEGASAHSIVQSLTANVGKMGQTFTDDLSVVAIKRSA